MMSKERELLKNTLSFLVLDWARGEKLYTQIAQLLAQPELSTDSLQLDKPVAWITEWVQRYRHNDTHIMDRAVSFTKGDAPAVPNPNYIPLYASPQKREPMTGKEISQGFRTDKDATNAESYWAGVALAEKHYGVDDEA